MIQTSEQSVGDRFSSPVFGPCYDVKASLKINVGGVRKPFVLCLALLAFGSVGMLGVMVGLGLGLCASVELGCKYPLV